MVQSLDPATALSNAQRVLIERGAAAAGEFLEQALESGLEHPLLLRALARLRMDQRRHLDAIALLERAVLWYEQADQEGNTSSKNGQNAGSAPDATLGIMPSSEDLDTFAKQVELEILSRRRSALNRPDEPGASNMPLDRLVAAQVARDSIEPELESEEKNLGAISSHDENYPGNLPSVESQQEGTLSDSEAILESSEEAEFGVDVLADDFAAMDEWTPRLPTAAREPALEFPFDDFGDDIADELPTRSELEHIPDKPTRAGRARILAADLCVRHGLDRTALRILTRLLEVQWWSATLRALERAIESGASVREIETASLVRRFWAENSAFWCWIGRSGSQADAYQVLSWPIAIALVRSFHGTPDICELEEHLYSAHEEWWGSDELREAYPGFYQYVRSGLTVISPGLESMRWLDPATQDSERDNRSWRKSVCDLEYMGAVVPAGNELTGSLPISCWHVVFEMGGKTSPTQGDADGANLFETDDDDARLIQHISDAADSDSDLLEED